jgi:hypothetical protein
MAACLILQDFLNQRTDLFASGENDV